MIPYGRQSISDQDIEAVVEVLRSDFLTQGPVVPAFEQAMCSYTGARYAVAVNSGTSALHIACLALGVGEGDWLWTTPITFVASANCARYCGARVDFVDIDPLSWNLSVSALKQKLEAAEQKGQLPKVLVAVHLCGLPCEMEAIHLLSKKYGFAVIEDSCHAVGGKYQGEPIGYGRYSDITIFSFHPVKNMTTAEGGMALTNSEPLAERMRRLRSHGITSDPELMTHPPDGPWYYQQIELGYNYRMTELQAALGISQLKRLDHFIQRRNEIATNYSQQLGAQPLQLPVHIPGHYSAFHLYVVLLDNEQEGRRRYLLEQLRSQGIQAHVHYIPVHTQPYYRQLGFQEGDFPEAEKYYRKCLTLPIYPRLSTADQAYVVETVKGLLQ